MIRNLVPVFLGCLLLPLPLLGDFHFESAMLAAIIGCFWGGIASSKLLLKRDSKVVFRILKAVFLFGLPVFLFSLFRGCFTWHGLGFWLLIPVPSVLFGITIGRLYRKLIVPLPATLTVLTLLFISVGVLLIEFLTLPHVYFFNHVWGTWPGPIYDETVTVGWNLILFRAITFAWILFLWFLPDWKRSIRVKLILVAAVLVLFPSYLFLPESGVVTPRSTLQQKLNSFQTEHFDLYYADESFTDQEIEYWALRHEFHFKQIVDQLEIDWPENRKIESYLYANAWQKKALVGAKFTSYVPIWLEQDQLHIAKEHLDAVLKHEMVHVISKQFGNELFNGSWSIGLIEGLAEGIAKDASRESTLDQIMAAEPPYPSSQQMETALSFKGFYSSAGAISYTTAGSFVNFLLSNYPVSDFKEAYATNDFETAYQLPFDTLVAGWQHSLPDTEIDSIDQQNSEFIFSQRSIFQKACPHVVTSIMEAWDQIRFYETNRVFELALPYVEEAYHLAPDNQIIKQKWIHYQLRFGEYEKALDAITPSDSIPQFLLMKADALALQKRWNEAYNLREQAWQLLPDQVPGNFQYSFTLRADTLNWTVFASARYKDSIPFQLDNSVNLPNQLLLAQQAVELNQWELVPAYASYISASTKTSDWFDVYEQLIDKLIFLREFESAQNWVNSVSELELRPRYAERLQEQREWLEFISK
ncbi:MAG: tetratricopeptide repeat protein [Balneola sp.]